jgi:hypothetical protein
MRWWERLVVSAYKSNIYWWWLLKWLLFSFIHGAYNNAWWVVRADNETTLGLAIKIIHDNCTENCRLDVYVYYHTVWCCSFPLNCNTDASRKYSLAGNEILRLISAYKMITAGKCT